MAAEDAIVKMSVRMRMRVCRKEYPVKAWGEKWETDRPRLNSD